MCGVESEERQSFRRHPGTEHRSKSGALYQEMNGIGQLNGQVGSAALVNGTGQGRMQRQAGRTGPNTCRGGKKGSTETGAGHAATLCKCERNGSPSRVTRSSGAQGE